MSENTVVEVATEATEATPVVEEIVVELTLEARHELLKAAARKLLELAESDAPMSRKGEVELHNATQVYQDRRKEMYTARAQEAAASRAPSALKAAVAEAAALQARIAELEAALASK